MQRLSRFRKDFVQGWAVPVLFNAKVDTCSNTNMTCDVQESGLSICELNECDAGYLLDTVSTPKQCVRLPENNCRGKSAQELEEMLQSLCEVIK